MILSCIVAVADNGVIGRDNGLPWKLSNDLKRFKRLTTGHTLVMGRKTFESIGKPLPQRRSIVLTRDPDFRAAGTTVAHSWEEALKACEDEPEPRRATASGAETESGPTAGSGNDQEVFVIGGAAVFREALPKAERLYLTRVHANVMGDVRFPDVDLNQWRCIEQASFPADEKNDYPTTYEVHIRR